MPHPESCQVCIFSQMAKNLQSLPNLFYMLFGPSLTKLNEEGLLYSNCLPAINANSQTFTNFLLTYNKEKAPLPLYSDLGAVLLQYTLGGEVLVCDCLSIGELFMSIV